MNRQVINVLIVEDRPQDAKHQKELLESRREVRYVVRTAFSMEQALKEISKKNVDVALIDFSTPGCLGVKSIQEIIAADRKVGIVGFLDYSDPNTEQITQAMGLVDFVTKPTTAEDLSKIIQFVVIRHEHLRKKLDIERTLSELGKVVPVAIENMKSVQEQLATIKNLAVDTNSKISGMMKDSGT